MYTFEPTQPPKRVCRIEIMKKAMATIRVTSLWVSGSNPDRERKFSVAQLVRAKEQKSPV